MRIDVPDDEYLVNLARHLVPGAVGRESAEQDPAMTPDVVARLAEVGGLPVVVKGVLRGDEALRCVEADAAGVVVSTHGGRQLDRALPSAHALAHVVAAVGSRAPVLIDGGIRSGTDALVALGLGAAAMLVGRPVLWALAAGERPPSPRCWRSWPTTSGTSRRWPGRPGSPTPGRTWSPPADRGPPVGGPHRSPGPGRMAVPSWSHDPVQEPASDQGRREPCRWRRVQATVG